jgi:predicted nucleic acid-binding protein
MWRFHTLAEEYGLSAYDAAYLELALRRGLRLATFDQQMISAARKAGIRIARPNVKASRESRVESRE